MDEKVVFFFICLQGVCYQFLKFPLSTISSFFRQQNVPIDDHYYYQHKVQQPDTVQQPIIGKPAHHLTHNHTHTSIPNSCPK